jgi:hypothetical protein
LLSVADDDPDDPASVGSWARFADLGESDGPPESADDCEDEFDSDDPDVESADIPCSIHFSPWPDEQSGKLQTRSHAGN